MRSIFRWIALVTVMLAPAPTWADNGIEIVLIRDDVPTGDDEYWVFAAFDKTGESGCSLTTPSGSAVCPLGWVATRVKGLDALKTSTIGSGAGTDWTIVWDSGVTAEIDFGTISIGDWPTKFPSIDSPPDGAKGVSPSTSIEWRFPGGAADSECVDACVAMHPLEDLTFPPGGLSCRSDFGNEDPSDTSWTPPTPLAPNVWDVLVNSSVSIRDVPVGITVTVGSWTLDNTDWLAAATADISTFTVVVVPALRGWSVGAASVVLVGAALWVLRRRRSRRLPRR